MTTPHAPHTPDPPVAAPATHPVRMTRDMARRFLLFLATNGGIESHADYVSIDDLWLALGED